MTRHPRAAAQVAVLGLALVLTAGVAGPAAHALPRDLGGDAGDAAARRGIGSTGMGDPYFPRDGNGGIDVQHYDVHDAYAFDSGRLSGRTGLDVVATQDLTRFDLDFLLPVRSVRVDGRRASFRQTGDHELRIRPAVPLPAGASFRVSVRYSGYPARERSQGESNWLADGAEVVTMNEPHMATWWFPANDHPRDKATFDIWITAPRHKDVIANGVLVSERRRGARSVTHWRAADPMATYLAFFAAGSYAVSRSTCLGVPNVFAVSRTSRANAPGKVARLWARDTCEMVTRLAGVLGPYPFTAIGGVVTGLDVGFALENQTRPTYPYLGVQPGVMVHELAHQWFGDLVSVSNWRDIWLNEGFAEYLSQLYYTELVGDGSMQQWLLDTYDAMSAAPTFWDLAIDDPGPRRIFDGAVYSRGAMALQALRHRIGDPAFWTLLRTWLQQHALGNGSVQELEALATAVSGQDLTSFFDAWLHARTPPARTATNGLV